MVKLTTSMAAIFLLAASSLCFAQAEIIDSKPMVDRANNRSSAFVDNPAAANQQSDLYYQLQMLQEEVQQLRGMVEEQAHEIRRLKQQQLDDYVDLDRRLSQMRESASGAAAPVPTGTSTPSTVSGAEPMPAPSSASPEEELATYDRAVRLIIKDKELDKGSTAMQEYIQQYPGGVYLSNAQYWVGQVAYIQGDMDAAKRWFSELIESNPSSQKAPEAKYKLGTVLHKLGEDAQAQEMLAEVASTSSSAARLAQEYLKNNFN